MITFLKKLFRRQPKPQREVCFVTYGHAAELLNKGWVLAPEEDKNHVIGMVYLEKKQK